MSKKKVLFVTQEMDPYTVIGEISEKVKNLPQKAYSNDFDVRILMPKFGPINERRHKLHEVVRLSGLNIIVDDEDYPLIIKVASLPGTRMQVYFLDNEEFFSRKSFFTDEDDESVFEDNQERMVFFCKGVFETVKKFGWAPDIIHCHGWFTSLIPAYLKTVYRDEPIFENSTCIYSAYTETFEAHFTPKFKEIASIVGIDEDKDLEPFMDGESVRLNRGAAHYADAVVVGSNDLPEDDKEVIAKLDKPVLEYLDEEENIKANYLFYKSFIVEE
jgi:starch synthase